MANSLERDAAYEQRKADLIFTHLKNTCAVYNDCNVSYVCLDGTALGLYRDNRIILGDSDFDLGVIYNRKNMIALVEAMNTSNPLVFTAHKRTNEFARRMFAESSEMFIDGLNSEYHHPHSLKVNHLENGIRTRDRIFGDTFILYDPATDFDGIDLKYFPADCYVYTFVDNSVKFISVPKELVNRTKLHTVDGFDFPVPEKTEQYLEYTYTETWNTPIRYKRIKYRYPVHVRIPDKEFLNIRVKSCI